MTGLNDTMFARPRVYATADEMTALRRIASGVDASTPGSRLFAEELERLTVVEAGGAPHVRLGSRVIYKDLRTKRQRLVRIVEPSMASVDEHENQISILSPIAAALMGLTTGAIFRWRGTDGTLRAVKVLAILGDA